LRTYRCEIFPGDNTPHPTVRRQAYSSQDRHKACCVGVATTRSPFKLIQQTSGALESPPTPPLLHRAVRLLPPPARPVHAHFCRRHRQRSRAPLGTTCSGPSRAVGQLWSPPTLTQGGRRGFGLLVSPFERVAGSSGVRGEPYSWALGERGGAQDALMWWQGGLALLRPTS